MKRDDLFYLEWAMIMAREAFEEGYSPVGAILATENGDVFPAASRREIGNIYHAEYRALLSKQEYPYPLDGIKSVLFSTLEPCIMCAGMATVMQVSRIAWLVDDFWGGARVGLNFNSPYIQKRWPAMDKIDIPNLHLEATKMWVDYLVRTGRADEMQPMLRTGETH